MIGNPVKDKVARGEVPLGTMVFEFSSSGLARLAAWAGAEFVIFDQEHTGWGTDTIRGLIATARGSDIVPFVRVPAAQYHLLARPLDVGAMGVMVPMVESEEQARLMVWSTKYPPVGRRGVGILHKDELEEGPLSGTLERLNREIMLIAQIETASGLENAEAIAGVDGIDCLWIGHFDLTASLGIPGQFEHEAFQGAVDRLLEICRSHGKPLGILATSVEEARAWLERGFGIVAYGGDLWLYAESLKAGLDELRARR
jgi:2-dehydro-3-deoxyglucarate aldolase/4-hydroxy-2-oxoheptanedioate aldolase